MGLEIIGLIAGLLAIIPVVISAMNERKKNRHDIGKVESDELLAGMDRVDAAHPPRMRTPRK